MSRKSSLSNEDIEQFRQAVGPVKPLRQEKAPVKSPPPPPVPRQTLKDNASVMEEIMHPPFDDAIEVETGEELTFARPGLQRTVLRKLRRGQFSINAELDLHGMTVPMAHQALSAFLQTCQLKAARCVRIIHGKGRNSQHGLPVLKHKLNKWLQQRNEVLAFCSARQIDGGTGAVYVLLKQN